MQFIRAISQQRVLVPVVHLVVASINLWLASDSDNVTLSLFVNGTHLLLVFLILGGISISTNSTSSSSEDTKNLTSFLLSAERNELLRKTSTFGGPRHACLLVSLVWLTICFVLAYLGFQQLFLDEGSLNAPSKGLSSTQLILAALVSLLLEISCLLSLAAGVEDVPHTEDLEDTEDASEDVKKMGSTRKWLIWLFGCCALGAWLSLVSTVSRMVLRSVWIERVDAVCALMGTILMAGGAVLVAKRSWDLGLRRASNGPAWDDGGDGSLGRRDGRSIALETRVEEKKKRAFGNIYAL